MTNDIRDDGHSAIRLVDGSLETFDPHPETATVTVSVQDWEGPQTIDEARCFDSGFKAGLTTYAREKGDSTLKSGNELLRRLMDEQGWKTIETFEKLQAKAGEEAFKQAVALTPEDPEQLEGFDCRAGFCPTQPESETLMLRKILAHVPAKVAIAAKEAAGYGVAIRTMNQIDDRMEAQEAAYEMGVDAEHEGDDQ